MRIAILLTDTDDSDFARAYPDDAEKFRRLLQPLRPGWEFTTYPVKDGIFPASIDAFEGLLVTGSPASVHDARDWIMRLFDLIRQARARRTPMIGACFGQQAIATALGGKVAANPDGWGLGAVTTTFSSWRSYMTPRHETLRLYCAHNERVVALPEGGVALGRDPIAEISAFALDDGVFCTQHHPEMQPDYVAALIDRMADAIDAPTLSRARQSLAGGAQGAEFAVWMANFYDAAVAAGR
jgi:GMP synthase-like glutamine amidotransferase